MATDLHLRLTAVGNFRALFAGKEPKIVITQPKALSKTTAGRLISPPANVWSREGGYSTGNVNVDRLDQWICQCLGTPIVNAIGQLYPAKPKELGSYLRVVITSDDESRAEMMNVPWEAVEARSGSLNLGDRFGVVRVLSPEAPQADPFAAGNRVRIIILWSNPYNDIPDLSGHLGAIQAVIKDRELDLLLVGTHELESISTAVKVLGDAFPDVVYYIGHAIQIEGQRVVLKIGKPGSVVDCTITEFRSLLEQIGSPRLLLLNSCATTVGHTLNPYLGAALGLAEKTDAVITMQTLMPVEAAHVFAVAFFEAIGNGEGIAECVKAGRTEISALLLRGSSLPPFSPSIPVLLQRTTQNQLFTIDISGRELRYLLLKLQKDIFTVEPYLTRKNDQQLASLFDFRPSKPRVGLILGPSRSGKSASVGRVIKSLLSEDRFRRGERYLYFDAAGKVLKVDDLDLQIRELFKAFAAYYSRLTRSLGPQLRDGGAETLIRVAAWLEEEERLGHKYCICIDSLTAELASEIAKRAANVITKSGRLILIADNADLAPDLLVVSLEITPMDQEEILSALQTNGVAAKGDDDVDQLLEATGGFPFFVARYLGGKMSTPAVATSEEERARYFIESWQPPLTSAEQDILRFAAYCSIPVPEQLFENCSSIFSVETSELLHEDHLLMKSDDGSYRIPGDLRAHLQNTTNDDDQRYFHEVAAKAFGQLALEKQDSLDEFTFQLTTSWFREAFEHLVEVVRLDAVSDEEEARQKLAQPRIFAELLHTRYLERSNQTTAAISLWERYREVSQSLEQYDDREADLRYADCLLRASCFDSAEDLLLGLEDDEADHIYVNALILHSNMIKERGERGAFSRRVDLLKRALTRASELAQKDPASAYVREVLANVEQSLGNTLGYGKEAVPEEASRHLEVAAELFRELKSPLQFRAINEMVEIKRYNGLLDEEGRQSAIRMLQENRSRLISREARYDAIMTRYELGRLAANATDRADYFREAFESAGDRYQPINWHAAINWRRAQIDADVVSFEEVASDLEKYCEALVAWQARSWSRRKRRNTLLFLSERYLKLNRLREARFAADKSWQVSQDILRKGEGRKDPARRLEVGCLRGIIALREGDLTAARAIAAETTNDRSAESKFDSMNGAELENFFVDLKGGNRQ